MPFEFTCHANLNITLDCRLDYCICFSLMREKMELKDDFVLCLFSPQQHGVTVITCSSSHLSLLFLRLKALLLVNQYHMFIVDRCQVFIFFSILMWVDQGQTFNCEQLLSNSRLLERFYYSFKGNAMPQEEHHGWQREYLTSNGHNSSSCHTLETTKAAYFTSLCQTSPAH